MKANGQKRGSVLMEFIIVFPIYLILFAGTVSVGDMLIHANRLASADRVTAFDVDGRAAGYARLGWAQRARIALGWRLVPEEVFHPGVEIADDGSAQDVLSSSGDPRYADTTGPWSVCAVGTARDDYKMAAGGTLGRLLSGEMLLNRATGGEANPFLSRFSGRVAMFSKDTRNLGSFYTLKRRDLYYQRVLRREGDNAYIRPDSDNWRDRTFISRLLRTQRGPGTENWRLEVANEGWHTSATMNGRTASRTCTEAYGTNIPGYSRYATFVTLSE